MAEHGTRDVPGGLAWKFDPLHQTSGARPVLTGPSDGAVARDQRARCSYIEGGDSALRLDATDKAERLAAMRARTAVVPGAGHHPHLERPEIFTDLVLDFLGGLPCAD